MATDILLINPCYTFPRERYIGKRLNELYGPALGLAYVAAVLEQADIKVQILDMAIYDMRPVQIGPVIEEMKPLLVGISAGMTFAYPSSIETARYIKKTAPQTPIILGGNHATYTCRAILQDVPEVDYVVRFEGEYTALALVQRLLTGESGIGISGVCYRSGNDIVVESDRDPIEDLDNLPLPARHLLPMDFYSSEDLSDRGLIMASRGCPYHCAYCSTSTFHGKKMRWHSPDRVVAEMAEVLNRYGAKTVTFGDDIFTVNRQHTLSVCQAICKSGIRAAWGCNTRVDVVDRELLEAMCEAGCRTIFYGIESCNQTVLDNVGKGFNLAQARSAIAITKTIGIKVQESFIVGLPGETLTSLNDIVDFIRETEPDGILLNSFMIYPGTPVSKSPGSYGIRSFSENWTRYEQMTPMVETDTMSADEIRRGFAHLTMGLMGIKTSTPVMDSKDDVLSNKS